MKQRKLLWWGEVGLFACLCVAAVGRVWLYLHNKNQAKLTFLYTFGSLRNGGTIYPNYFILGNDGALYGVAMLETIKNGGAVVRFEPRLHQLKVLHLLVTGIPTLLLQGPDSTLYGLSRGTTLFALRPDGTNFRTLTVRSPIFLVSGPHERLYGICPCNYSHERNKVTLFVYPLHPSTDHLTYRKELPLYINTHVEIATPMDTGFALGSDGWFYGFESSPKENHKMTFFRFSLNGTRFQTLAIFRFSKLAHPSVGSALELPDKSFCMPITFEDGTGALWRFSPQTHTFSEIHKFTDKRYGLTPISPLVLGSDGKLYGVLLGRTPTEKNLLKFPYFPFTIYRLNTDGSHFEPLYTYTPQHISPLPPLVRWFRSLLHQPTSPSPYSPFGKWPTQLIWGGNNTLYGIAQYGGHYGLGILFRLEVPPSAS